MIECHMDTEKHLAPPKPPPPGWPPSPPPPPKPRTVDEAILFLRSARAEAVARRRATRNQAKANADNRQGSALYGDDTHMSPLQRLERDLLKRLKKGPADKLNPEQEIVLFNTIEERIKVLKIEKASKEADDGGID
jgi:hypothetical protein